MKTRARFSLIATLLLTALGLTSAQTKPGLRALADVKGILIGTAVDPGVLFDTLEPEYAKILFKEFSVITPENAMKFSALSGARGKYNFSGPDALVALAAKNNQRVRGHTLIWHEQLPNWLIKEIAAKTPSRDEMMALMTQHINTVAGHFAGKLAYWDVVNEAITESGGLRETPWLKAIGPDYIANAFTLARAADPKAKLCYNDFNTDGFNPKSDRVYLLVKELKALNAPIDCVGFQAHVDQNFSSQGARLKENLERFAALGLEVQFTEVDVQLKGSAPKADRLAAQAKVYGELLGACLSVKGCTAFVMWGFTDAHSWRAGNEPLIFDSGYKSKPAYDALKRTLENQPK
jgi:endo-1,4-beta-xylanase